MKKCECRDWKENIDKVNAPWLLSLSAVGKYTGKPFTHCPWCGWIFRSVLKEKEQVDINKASGYDEACMKTMGRYSV